MHFDLFTLGVIGAAIGIAISISFTLLGLVLRGLPALRIWATAFWVITAAALTQGLNENGSLLSTVVGGGLIALANALMLMGIAIHLRYPLRWRWPLAVVGLFVACQVDVYLSPPTQTVSALMFGGYSVVWDAWMVWVLLWRSPRDMRSTCSFTALIFIIDALFYLLRSVVVLFPQLLAHSPLDELLTTWNYLFGILSSFLLSTGFTLMLAERLTLDLRRLARTDGLTGLLNRSALIEAGARLVDACRARGQGCSVLMFDLDHFKSINDNWGHAAGDAVLIHFVAVIRSVGLPRGTLFARYGGEEFMLLLPAIEPAHAAALAERMRTAVAAAPAVSEGSRIDITTSVGGATAVDANVEQLVNAADVALYRAKHQGRNQVAWNSEA
ncbi:GGDEF domain-containing protein [Rhodanobacter denitrificans]|uniref:GGDEF domain-containing protein n=1 Tax=Rhodanobacter denitrificans TaxID=666685 RepID=UPI000260FB2B|nr:GGDEF domain-containing protein [Rhodanobacter denitrificans]EIM01529.1 diguanylate cyclase [Rhodanobacter denitrificans]UJM91892.1 GGDEF domain-containing protein [Rhodanobacter denitrificans]